MDIGLRYEFVSAGDAWRPVRRCLRERSHPQFSPEPPSAAAALALRSACTPVPLAGTGAGSRRLWRGPAGEGPRHGRAGGCEVYRARRESEWRDRAPLQAARRCRQPRSGGSAPPAAAAAAATHRSACGRLPAPIPALAGGSECGARDPEPPPPLRSHQHCAIQRGAARRAGGCLRRRRCNGCACCPSASQRRNATLPAVPPRHADPCLHCPCLCPCPCSTHPALRCS
jgi:hypothetical protein